MAERVDFYVLPGQESRQRLFFACRLAEKAYLRDLKIAVVTDGGGEAALLDEMLWTFNDRSFVPHVRGPQDPATPVQIVDRMQDAAPADLLINLSIDAPPDTTQFARIAEIIDADAGRKVQGRERFRRYREQNLPLETHTLGANADI